MNIAAHGPPLIMGILNITPDSFSDGGRFDRPEAAIRHGRRMIDEGADIIDIGGESTRPGSARVSEKEQIGRVLPVIEQLGASRPARVAISIDTRRAGVAEAALDAGASIVNDVSGGNDDPDIIALCVERGCGYIINHMRGRPETMQRQPEYADVVGEVRRFLEGRAEDCQQAGMRPHHIVIDPGIGFGKTQAHNLALLKHLRALVEAGYAVLLGASRKRFMGGLCKTDTPAELVGATAATTALGVAAGVRIFRVHDVRENRQAADVAWAIANCSV